ncbi:MAG: hypothetical protein K0R73_1096 [Candidatus Midichloriaceae bacterium]|jgi:hypothetical protein|nr:hypothetical protein [Candidatus Midichloriaceae bacterium]
MKNNKIKTNERHIKRSFNEIMKLGNKFFTNDGFDSFCKACEDIVTDTIDIGEELCETAIDQLFLKPEGAKINACDIEEICNSLTNFIEYMEECCNSSRNI